MKVQLYDNVYDVPDHLASKSDDEIAAFIQQQSKPKEEPSFGTYLMGALRKGAAEGLDKEANLANLVGSGGAEQTARGMAERLRSYQDYKDVIANPPTSTLGELAFGLAEFAPQIPLYMGGGKVATSALTGLGKLGVPLAGKIASFVTPVAGEGVLMSSLRAAGHGALSGGVVGAAAAAPDSTLMERAANANKEAQGFAVGAAGFTAAFKILAKGLSMATGKASSRFRNNADIDAALAKEGVREKILEDADLANALKEYETVRDAQASTDVEYKDAQWLRENRPFGQDYEGTLPGGEPPPGPVGQVGGRASWDTGEPVVEAGKPAPSDQSLVKGAEPIPDFKGTTDAMRFGIANPSRVGEMQALHAELVAKMKDPATPQLEKEALMGRISKLTEAAQAGQGVFGSIPEKFLERNPDIKAAVEAAKAKGIDQSKPPAPATEGAQVPGIPAPKIEGSTVTIYHATTPEVAAIIRKSGFKDLTIEDLVDHAIKLTGASKSSKPAIMKYLSENYLDPSEPALKKRGVFFSAEKERVASEDVALQEGVLNALSAIKYIEKGDIASKAEALEKSIESGPREIIEVKVPRGKVKNIGDEPITDTYTKGDINLSAEEANRYLGIPKAAKLPKAQQPLDPEKKLGMKFVPDDVGRDLANAGASRAEVQAIVDSIANQPISDVAIDVLLKDRGYTTREIARWKDKEMGGSKREVLTRARVEEALDAELAKRGQGLTPEQRSAPVETTPQLDIQARIMADKKRAFEAKIAKLEKSGIKKEEIAAMTPEQVHARHAEVLNKDAADAIAELTKRRPADKGLKGLEMAERTLNDAKALELDGDLAPSRLELIQLKVIEQKLAKRDAIASAPAEPAPTRRQRRTPEEEREINEWLDDTSIDLKEPEVPTDIPNAPTEVKPTVELKTVEDYEAFLKSEGMGADLPPEGGGGGYTMDFMGLQQMYEIARDIFKREINKDTLSLVGRGLMLEGSKDFPAFKKRMEEVAGPAWPAVKGNIGDLFEQSKAWHSNLMENGILTYHGTKIFFMPNERGEIGYDLRYAGTGEGAAYRGWGIYTTKSVEIAERNYAERLARKANERALESQAVKVGDTEIDTRFLKDVLGVTTHQAASFSNNPTGVMRTLLSEWAEKAADKYKTWIDRAEKSIEISKLLEGNKSATSSSIADLRQQSEATSRRITDAQVKLNNIEYLLNDLKDKPIEGGLKIREGHIKIGKSGYGREALAHYFGMYERDFAELLKQTPSDIEAILTNKAVEYGGMLERETASLRESNVTNEQGLKAHPDMYVGKDLEAVRTRMQERETQISLNEEKLQGLNGIMKKIYEGEEIKANIPNLPFRPTVYENRHLPEIEEKLLNLDTELKPEQRAALISALDKEVESGKTSEKAGLEPLSRIEVVDLVERLKEEQKPIPTQDNVYKPHTASPSDIGQVIREDVTSPFTGDVIIKKGDVITPEMVQMIGDEGISWVPIMTPSGPKRALITGGSSTAYGGHTVMDAPSPEFIGQKVTTKLVFEMGEKMGWDAQVVTKSPSSVQSLNNPLKNLVNRPREGVDIPARMTGHDLQYKLWEIFGNGDTHAKDARKLTSEFLRDEAGIPGNKFVSQGGGAETYVWFDPKHAQPVREYTLDSLGGQQMYEAVVAKLKKMYKGDEKLEYGGFLFRNGDARELSKRVRGGWEAIPHEYAVAQAMGRLKDALSREDVLGKFLGHGGDIRYANTGTSVYLEMAKYPSRAQLKVITDSFDPTQKVQVDTPNDSFSTTVGDLKSQLGKSFKGEVTFDFMGGQQATEALYKLWRRTRDGKTTLGSDKLKEALLGKDGKEWLHDRLPDPDAIRVWETEARQPMRVAQKIGEKMFDFVTRWNMADLSSVHKFAAAGGHRDTLNAIFAQLDKAGRMELGKVVENKAKASSEKVATAAGQMRDWLDMMWGNKIESKRADFKHHLKPEEYEALMQVIDKKYSPETVFSKFDEKDAHVLRGLVDDYRALESKYIPDYMTHFEKGSIVLRDKESGGKVVAVGVSPADAIRKAQRIKEADPSAELWMDTNFMKDMPQGVGQGQYFSVIKRLAANNDKILKELNEGIAKGESTLAAKRAVRGLFMIKPTYKFSAFEKRRFDILAGEEDVSSVLFNYAYTMERKNALDPLIAEARTLINRDYAGQPNAQEFLRNLIEDTKGRYHWQDKAADDLIRWIGRETGIESMETASMTATKGSALAREAEGYVKLAYRPVAAIFNYLGGQGNVWTQNGTKYFNAGYKFLASKEGKQFIKEMEPYMGQTFAHEGEMLKPRHKSFESLPWWTQPLGMFERPEIPNRSIGLAAPYLMARDSVKNGGLGMGEAEARIYAFQQNVFSQATYNIANLPAILRSPLGKTMGQFKTYMINQLEFMAHLSAPQAARFMMVQAALGGPRAIVAMLKTAPVLAMFGWWGEIEQWMDKNWPRASRGVGGALGVDVTGPAALQIPQSMSDWAGPFISDMVKTYNNVLKGYMSGEKVRPQTMKEVGEFATSIAEQVSPLMKTWPKLLIDKIANPHQNGYIIKDSRGREIYRLENVDLAKVVMGAEPLESARIKQFESREKQHAAQLSKRKAYVTDAIVDALNAGEIVPPHIWDEMYTLGIRPATLRREMKMRALSPEARRIIQTELLRRGEIMEEFPKPAQ